MNFDNIKNLSDSDIRKLSDLLAREKVTREMRDIHKYDISLEEEMAERWYEYFENQLKRKGYDSEDDIWRISPYYAVKKDLFSICDSVCGNYDLKEKNDKVSVYRRAGSSHIENAKKYMELYNKLVEVIDKYID